MISWSLLGISGPRTLYGKRARVGGQLFVLHEGFLIAGTERT